MQFTAVPWLREHLIEQIRALVGDLLLEPAAARRAARPRCCATAPGARPRRARACRCSTPSRPRSSGPSSTELTAVMSLLEGHADVVMDEVGPAGRPVRRRDPGSGSAAAAPGRRRRPVLRRLLGLDAKLRQYRDGAALRPRGRRRGRHGRLQRACGRGPRHLPRPGRDRRPGRLGRAGSTADGRLTARHAGPAPRSPRYGWRRPAACCARPAARRRASCWSPATAAPTPWPWPPRTAFEAPRAGLRAGAVDRRPRAAGRLGRRSPRPRRPLRRAGARPGRGGRRVDAAGAGHGGPEAAAREARYARSTRPPTGSARPRCCSATPATTRPRPCCSGWPAARGARSLAGMAARPRPLPPAAARPRRGRDPSRPARRSGSSRWDDPHNADPALRPGPGPRRGCCRRWRTRSGPGVAAALARTRRPARAPTPTPSTGRGRRWLAHARRPTAARRRRAGALPAAVRRRVLAAARRSPPARRPARSAAGTSLAVDALVTDWHGQGPVDLPGRASPPAGGVAGCGSPPPGRGRTGSSTSDRSQVDEKPTTWAPTSRRC